MKESVIGSKSESKKVDPRIDSKAELKRNNQLSNSDPFDEFEFRPLTEGLGFHKKETIQEPVTTFQLQNNLPEIEMPMGSKNSNPIPSRPSPVTSKQSEQIGQVDAILKTLQTKRNLDFEDKNKKKNIETVTYRASYNDISALILDSMLVIAAGIACMLILISTTQIDLFAALAQSQDVNLLLGIVGIFAACSWIFLTINRIFIGATPGEWVFDQRVGREEEQSTALYQVQVALRSTMVVATGLIVLPLLSIVFGFDLAGQMSGARLLKKA